MLAHYTKRNLARDDRERASKSELGHSASISSFKKFNLNQKS